LAGLLTNSKFKKFELKKVGVGDGQSIQDRMFEFVGEKVLLDKEIALCLYTERKFRMMD
jgi:hypothetical protein